MFGSLTSAARKTIPLTSEEFAKPEVERCSSKIGHQKLITPSLAHSKQ
jgi:hypothetical protein